MSKSLTVLNPIDTVACCSPLAHEPLSQTAAEAIAPLLKALADPVRLRLMSLVASREGGEACICELIEPVGLSQGTVSHHMKVLVDAGFLTRDQRGKWAYYAVVPGALEAIALSIASPATALA